jgi:threonine dehydratase
MAIEGRDWFQAVDVPDTFKWDPCFFDVELRHQSKEWFYAHYGLHGTEQEIDAYILSNNRPYSYTALVAGAVLASNEPPIGQTPLEEVDGFSEGFRLFVKQENLLGSFTLRGSTYARMNASGNSEPAHLEFDTLAGISSKITEVVDSVKSRTVKHLYVPLGSGTVAHSLMVAREFFGVKVDLVAVQTEGSPEAPEKMCGYAASLITYSGARILTVSAAEAAQASIDYRVLSGGQLVDLEGASAIAAVRREASQLHGRVVAVTNGGNISEEQFELSTKAALS